MKALTRTAFLFAAVGFTSLFASPNVDINDPTSAGVNSADGTEKVQNTLVESGKIKTLIIRSDKMDNPILNSIEF